ncbi:hypothetical protein ACLKMH_06400 [Psychromonas sp. KJ10-10]|uniref:hypothetical protein n=1 Tax=Psychromonas sp. KJ10-10 TaxID=3391823 RepID=UPI0039B5CE65
MQSILLATPNKASKLEMSSEQKLSGDAITSQGKTDEGKKATGFASILDQTVAEKTEQDNKASKIKNETSSSELLSKSLTAKEVSKAEKVAPVLADSNQDPEAKNKDSNNDDSSIQLKTDSSVKGNLEESLKVESSVGKSQKTDDGLIETEFDDDTASQKVNKENIVAPLSADKTQVVNSENDIISPIQAQSVKENSKSDAEFQEKQVTLSSEPLSVVTSSQNKDFSKSKSESSAVIDETKQVDSSANNQQLDETKQVDSADK